MQIWILKISLESVIFCRRVWMSSGWNHSSGLSSTVGLEMFSIIARFPSPFTVTATSSSFSKKYGSGYTRPYCTLEEGPLGFSILQFYLFIKTLRWKWASSLIIGLWIFCSGKERHKQDGLQWLSRHPKVSGTSLGWYFRFFINAILYVGYFRQFGLNVVFKHVEGH